MISFPNKLDSITARMFREAVGFADLRGGWERLVEKHLFSFPSTYPMLRFKSWCCAYCTDTGGAVMCVICCGLSRQPLYYGVCGGKKFLTPLCSNPKNRNPHTNKQKMNHEREQNYR